MDVKVRSGTRDDIEALVEVECSDVEVWHHFSSEGRGAPASYQELTPSERCMHGGPWMDAGTLTRYWHHIERLGIVPLVAELNGKVVGHLDVIFSSELSLGSFLYLDVLTIHKAYRRRGVAKSLIKEAERLAKSRKARYMLVQPQQYEGPSGLTYTSCGFKKAFDVYDLEMPVNQSEIPSGVRLVSVPRTQEAPLDTHAMICGWYNIGAKMWDYGVNPDVELLHAFSAHQLALSALTNGSVYFLHLGQNFSDPSTGTLCLWAPTPLEKDALQRVLQAATATASWLGMKRLTTKSVERHITTLEKAGFVLKSRDEPYLAKELE